ncbi:MAG: hypothetical protein HOQ05_02850 [Corynebacteriales bacterium]|nr:hypothetical protein [Mycobacteriales bacterium]
MDALLLAEAMKKASIIWVQTPGNAAQLLWTVWIDGAAYVVHGSGEQDAPELPDGGVCDVVVRSADNHAQILRWPARINTVSPGTEQWQTVVPTLLSKRLNLTDSDTAEERWATNARVSALTPQQ